MDFQRIVVLNGSAEEHMGMQRTIDQLLARIRELESEIILLKVTDAAQEEDVLRALDIPVIAEITPQPDPVYGHTLKWLEEVEQFLSPDRPTE